MSLRLGSLMQQLKKCTGPGRTLRRGGRGGGLGQGGGYIRDHIFRAGARLPSQSQCVRPRKAEQAQPLRWTHRGGLSGREALGSGINSSDANTWREF